MLTVFVKMGVCNVKTGCADTCFGKCDEKMRWKQKNGVGECVCVID